MDTILYVNRVLHLHFALYYIYIYIAFKAAWLIENFLLIKCFIVDFFVRTICIASNAIGNNNVAIEKCEHANTGVRIATYDSRFYDCPCFVVQKRMRSYEFFHREISTPRLQRTFSLRPCILPSPRENALTYAFYSISAHPSSLLHFQRHEPFLSAIVETIIKLCRVSLRATKVSSCLRNLILNLRVDLRNERMPSLEFVSNSLYRTGTLRVSWISNDPVKRSTFKTIASSSACFFVSRRSRYSNIRINYI